MSASSTALTESVARPVAARPVASEVGPELSRAVFFCLIAASAIAAPFVTGVQETGHAVALAGTEWAHLLRGMAVLKAIMAASATGAVMWRLGSGATPAWLAAYGTAGAAMAAGPGLIWGLAHIALGAVLLHAGLVATLLLLWRDKTFGARLAALVAVRQAMLRR